MNIFVRLIVLIIAVPLIANAQQEPVMTFVDRVSFSGEVDRVLFVVADARAQPEVVEGTWVASHEGDDVSCIAQIPVSATSGPLQVLSLVLGTQGEVVSAFREVMVEEISPALYLSLPELRSRFIERRGVFRQLQNEVQKQEERLRVLQDDADAIAMVSKIVSTEDELAEIKAKLQRIATAHDGIIRRTAQLKTVSPPLNAQKREFELVRQLRELSTALSTVENRAIKKLAGAKGVLHDKLALIEETREEHIALLEEELARLRRER